MPRTFASVPENVFRIRWADIDDYERVDTVPEGLRWMPFVGTPGELVTVLRSLGDYYRLVRWRATGEVVYYRRKDALEPKSPAKSIDAEPEKARAQYRVGAVCWFIAHNELWYCVEVVARSKRPCTITIRSRTGWDAERIAAWPYSDLLEFPAHHASVLFERLRPLKARRT